MVVTANPRAPFTDRDTVYCRADPDRAPYFVCKVVCIHGTWLMYLGTWRWVDMDNIEDKCKFVVCNQFSLYP